MARPARGEGGYRAARRNDWRRKTAKLNKAAGKPVQCPNFHKIERGEDCEGRYSCGLVRCEAAVKLQRESIAQ